MTTQFYSIDNHELADCGSRDPLTCLGLYANFIASPASLAISGDINVRNDPTFRNLITEDRRYRVLHTFDETLGLFTFDYIWQKSQLMSQFLVNQLPTHRIAATDNVKKNNANRRSEIWIFHFGLCSGTSCVITEGLLSNPDHIFFEGDAWKGPSNSAYPTDRMIVFNVGVVKGSSIAITTTTPTAGLAACRAIYNFYPMDIEKGGIVTDAEIKLYRRTGGKWGGLSMNLYDPVYDSSKGNYAGQLIAKSYAWENPLLGADILDYQQLGENCYGKFPCWIPTNVTTPTVTRSNVSTETETSRTITKVTEHVYSTEIDVTSTTTTTLTYTLFDQKFDVTSITRVFTDLNTLTVPYTTTLVQIKTETNTETSTVTITITELDTETSIDFFYTPLTITETETDYDVSYDTIGSTTTTTTIIQLIVETTSPVVVTNTVIVLED